MAQIEMAKFDFGGWTICSTPVVFSIPPKIPHQCTVEKQLTGFKTMPNRIQS